MDDTPKIIRKHKPRAPEFAWRQLPDGGYNHKPTDPEYFKKYMAMKVACPMCGTQVSHGELSKHKKRAVCQKRRDMLAQATENTS
jgi:hypothetical protein